MPTVAFVNPKGGAGKTTAALLLALGLSEQGHRVAMIDSDPNKPLVHWANLPGRPDRISVHPAPMTQDIRDALREAQRKQPDWLILDTEGSIRGAMNFTTMRLDLVLTPLASSAIEALQAIKAAEMVAQFGKRGGAQLLHRCLLTRVPAALRPRSLKQVVEQLRESDIGILPTALIEKEAFRMLFSVGGGFTELERSGVSGVPAARANAQGYLAAVLELLESAKTQAA
ncbi:MAG: ParA family protein [Phenylobacterium sp.]|uniref:ParA family protein n=1 Tax=Phenylobacterium sp. TaxID=1871053 RepID=UPI0027325AA5|nr:ParA family protein [Phenylobacterium sp.]MDP3749396.1 ParA family protein [Phenylobacterium sp.]